MSIILSGDVIELYELSILEYDDVLIHLIMRCFMKLIYFEIIYIIYSYTKLYIYVLELLQHQPCQTDDEVRELRDRERC